jgi:hypothetical protein
VFLGSEAFVERHYVSPNSPERLREVPRAQRRPLASPLAEFARRYPVRAEAMAQAFQSGVYTMQKIGDYFSLSYRDNCDNWGKKFDLVPRPSDTFLSPVGPSSRVTLGMHRYGQEVFACPRQDWLCHTLYLAFPRSQCLK